MNRVIVIGNSYRTEVIRLKDSLSANRALSAGVNDCRSGGAYSIAYNLAVLDTDTYLLTRLSYDSTSAEMILNLDKLNGMVYANNSVLPKTPSRIYLIDKYNKAISLDDFTFSVYPGVEDGFPILSFEDDDYGLIKYVNTNYFLKAVATYPNVKWVCYNSLPENKVLNLVEGVVFDYDYLIRTVNERDIPNTCSELIKHGLKWILIVEEGQFISHYDYAGFHQYRKDEQGEHVVGCFEAFLSMLMACLANGYDLVSAINHGLNLANDLSYQESVVLKKEFF
ncbi:MAG: hypothetical protein IKX74_00360 [Erysipelotrichaceae bacterium]|nr:hypothetical protein [Erysipelotrichaceae bacterium]MBR5048099.1 hypothetical protein [Erysipelotrichaceae bacterium]